MRAVDDFCEFLVNMIVTSTEKLALYGIDEVGNTARAFMCSSFLFFFLHCRASTGHGRSTSEECESKKE